MASSSKRKEDDKNLKLLRELACQPANKFCFDCEQKGPTYINMTIGSFVCTSCSGILRGLTPPHRVKSITMASFSTEEIDQLRHRGNHYCRAVWLGLLKNAPLPGAGGRTSDESRLRDMLIDKYEKKRYYIDPIVVAKNMSQEQAAASATAGASTTTTTSPTPPQPVTPPQSTVISRHVSTEAAAAVPNSQSPLVTTAPEAVPSFANFDTANIFTQTNTPPTAGQTIQTSASGGRNGQQLKAGGGGLLQPLNPLGGANAATVGGANGARGGARTTAEDRYAALKSLDEEFKTHLQPVETGVAGLSVAAGAPSANSGSHPVVSGAGSPPNYFASANAFNAFGGGSGGTATAVGGGNGNVFGAAAAANGGGAGHFGGAAAVPIGVGGLFGGAFDPNGVGVGGPFGAAVVTSPFGSSSVPAGPFGSPPTFGNVTAPTGPFGSPPSFGTVGPSVSNGVVGVSSPFGIFGTSPGGAAASPFGTSPGAAWGAFGATQTAAPNPFAGFSAALPATSSNYNPFTAGGSESSFSNNNNNINKNGNAPTAGVVDSTNNWANFSAFNTGNNSGITDSAGHISAITSNNNKNSDKNIKNLIGNNTSASNNGNAANNNWANFSMNNFASTTTTTTTLSTIEPPSSSTAPSFPAASTNSNNNWANFGDSFTTSTIGSGFSSASAATPDPWSNATANPTQQSSSSGLFGNSSGPSHTAISPASFNPFL